MVQDSAYSQHTGVILSAASLTLQRGYRVLLKDFDFTLNPGDGVSLRGANGVGKTTLLRALAGLHVPMA